MAWMPSAKFEKSCGKFKIEAYYDGSPQWHTITLGGADFSLLQADDLRDLRYLIDRAIAYHEEHGG